MSERPGIASYPNVFTPIALGPVELPNRIYMAPHGIPLEAPTPGRAAYAEPAEERVHYFAERAAGGVGLIIHSTQVAPFAVQDNLAENPGLPESIPSYRRVAEAVHEHGAKLMAEIWYVNWIPKRWEKLGPEAPGLAPSVAQNLAWPSVRRQMTKEEIRRLVDAHATAARHLREAGYDGIELHVSHGSIVEYFLTPYWNRRTDEYGGSLENRARLMLETLEAIRGELGDRMALGVRINADELLPGGVDEEQTRAVIRLLEATGLLDFVDIDVSVEPEQAHLMTTGMFDPTLHNADRVARVGAAAGALPVLATPGRITNLVDAEHLIAKGVADVVGAVRGLIAEPALVNLARDGREHHGRVCVAVNACVDPQKVGWGCAINASAAREVRWSERDVAAAPRPTTVVVVGGGPAGLEAARIAAIRGHRVTLIEREPRIGGGVALWGDLPGRGSMRAIAGYFERRLADLGVALVTGTEAGAAAVLERSPEVVVLATGSRYDRQGISGFAPWPVPGWDRDIVSTPEDVLHGAVAQPRRAVVLDDEGFHTGCGVAEVLAAAGAEVTYVTRKATVAAGLGIAIRYVAARLRSHGVAVHSGHYVREIGDGSVTVFDVATGDERRLEAIDRVVLCTMRTPRDELHAALEAEVPYVYLVGDALAPRGLREATYEGHRFGRVIGEPDMPASVIEELFRANAGAPRPAAAAPR